MTRWQRLRGATTTLALGTLVAGAFVAMTPATASAEPTEGGALGDFGACLGSAGAGDVLVLVDASGSLAETDPENDRVSAATYLVERMAATAAKAGFTIDAAVAEFSSSLDLIHDWTPLDPAGTERVSTAVASLSESNTGRDTDYWTALEGARAVMADRTSALGGGDRCQAVVWFSDGAFEIEPGRERRGDGAPPYAAGIDLGTADGLQEASDAAAVDLCRPGGVADQLRSSEVKLFAVGLSPDGSAEPFDLMSGLATGVSAGGVACGAVTSPTPGEFFLASNIDDLIFAFDRFAAPGESPLSSEAGICQGQVCAELRHTFVLDDSITSVDILAASGIDGVEVYLQPPGGDPVMLPREATSQPIAGAASTSEWVADRTVAVEMLRSAEGWTGQWGLIFVDPTGTSADQLSRAQIRVASDLRPTWTAPSDAVVHVGEVLAGTTVGLATADGTPVDPAGLLGPTSVTARLVAPDGSETVVLENASPDQLGQPLDLDLTAVSPGRATVRLDLQVRTADATLPDGSVAPGTDLTPVRVDVPLYLAPPVDIPVVATTLSFGTAEGPMDATRTVPITGAGCVWLDPASTAVVGSPSTVGEVAVGSEHVSPETCLEADGEAGLPLSLTTAEAGNGSVNGAVVVMAAPVGEPDRAVATEVTFSGDMRRPLNRPLTLAVFLAALALGPAIPLALLWVLKARGARIPRRGLHAQRYRVTVDESGVRRDGAALAFGSRELVELVPRSGARVVEAAGVRLRPRTGWSPFGAPDVTVEAPGLIGVTSSHPSPGKRIVLPLAVHNTWILLIDPARATTTDADVIVLVGADASEDVRARLLQDLQERAPRAAEALRSRAAGAADGSPGAPPSGTRGRETATERTEAPPRAVVRMVMTTGTRGVAGL
ncbi:VWA domain-containing protein [Serinibacter arcticus]|uniref:VWA domain-containing protein n=1 Tax=Serinibacter arcticus TaxID=1655435 RepID=UPI0011B22D43|nr:vWA domain-containing protein [Serinibacter arcticus]